MKTYFHLVTKQSQINKENGKYTSRIIHKNDLNALTTERTTQIATLTVVVACHCQQGTTNIQEK